MIDKNKIKALRLARRLSLSDAAIQAGWGYNGRSRWHDIETGRRASLTTDTLAAMARALECSPRSFLLAEAPVSPGRFRVSGVDRESRLDTTWYCDADSEANAKVKAELEGIIVTSVSCE